MPTQWLVPLGVVDPNDVPIAREGGEDAADGLTTRMLYDSNLADGVGLDSAAGIPVSKPGWGMPHLVSRIIFDLEYVTSNNGTLRGYVKFAPKLLLNARRILAGDFESGSELDTSGGQ